MIRRPLFVLLVVATLLAGCIPGQPLFTSGEVPTVTPIMPTTPTATAAAIAPTPAPTSAPAAAPTLEAPATFAPAPLATPSTVQTPEPAPTATQTITTLANVDVNVDLSESMTVDPAIRQGVLSNGLTYLIRQNSQPTNRAELRLGVNAGSLMEDEDQLGLAHFIEHMLFNGTKRFPKTELVDFLESTGMRFGPDINAYTSFDETVYELQFPLDNDKLVSTAFDVLVEWAANATLDPAEIDRERGVIVEEHRLRDLNAEGRLRDKILPLLLADSRYGERMPIGDMNIVRNAQREALQRFYHDWYRPDLMVVVAVGDFEDMDQVEAMIKEKFGPLQNPADAPQRLTYTVPDFKGTRYTVATDPENPETSVQVFFKQPAQLGDSYGLYRKTLVNVLFFRMLNARYAEITRTGGAPFAYAGGGPTDLVRMASANVLAAGMEEEKILDALDALMVEVERVHRFGFTQAEIERARADVLETYRGLADEAAAHESSSYAEEYLRHYFTGEGIPGIAREYELVQTFLPGISLNEVNAQVDALLSEDNRVVAVVAPEKAGFTPPTEDQVAEVMARVAARELEPRAAETATRPLMTEIPEPARIISSTDIAKVGVRDFRLENGVRVLLKNADFNKEEVLFAGFGPGGVSLVEDSDVPNARLAPVAVSESGVGDFSRTELDRMLTGKTLEVSPNMDDLTQGVSGYATMADMETALQLMHLYVTSPRVDAAAVESIKTSLRTLFRNRALDPDAALEDAVTRLLYSGSVRRQSAFTLGQIDALDAQRALEIYRDRFADVNDWTFIFVGNFEEDQLLPLVQRYVGTLPAAGRVETWKSRVPAYPAGIHEEEVRMGSELRSTTQIIFSGPYDPAPINETRLAMLRRILNIRVREELRENLSATYSPYINESIETVPDQQYLMALNFTTDPARTQELVDAAFAIIRDLQENGPSAKRLATAQEQERRVWEEQSRSNAFWLDTLRNWALDPADNDVQNAMTIQERIDEVTASDIQSAAKEYLRLDRYIRVTLNPAGSGATVWVMPRVE